MPDERTNEAHLTERQYSNEERTQLAKDGKALPDGSFPIADAQDLEHAVRAFGRSGDETDARKLIIKRAHELGRSDMIPHEWDHTDGDTYHNHLQQMEHDAGVHESLRESTEILEAETRTENGRHIAEVTLIRAGTSRNGNVYSSDVLKTGASLFEGSRAFADHPKDGDLPERSVRDLVGHYRNVHLDEQSRLRAELHLVPGNDWLFHLLTEAQAYPDLCGLSIDADGDVDRASPPRTVNALIRVNSVDIVTRPSAGGRIDRILQSTRPTPTEGATPVPDATQPTTPTTEPTPPAAPAAPATDLATLVEAQNKDLASARAELDRVQQILNPAGPTQVDEHAQIASLVEEMKRDRDLERATRILESTLGGAHLPEPVARKLNKRFTGRLFELASLEDAIADEKETLAQLTSAGQITGMGAEKPSLTPGMSEYDQLQAAFDGMFDIHESEEAKRVPPFTGIREAFRIATGTDINQTGSADRPLLEAYQRGLRAKVARGNLTEAEVILRETDVQTSTFSFLLGTSMNKRLLKDYQAWPSEWQKIASIVAIKDFKQQDRVRLGAFGSLSTVAEDAPYTTLVLADTRAIYTPTKRGNLVQVTRETIVNDDLYAIKQIPQKLAVAAAFTLAEFVYNLLAPNFGNIYDAHPLFDSINHKNSAVIAANLNTTNSGGALTSADLQTAVIAMRKQTNMASKPMGLKPRYLLVPPDLEFTAMTILKSAGLPGGNNNDVNPMMGYMEPIVAPQLNTLSSGPTSVNIWIAVADPRVIDTLEVGFVGGQANPVLLIQDMPLYGLNFTQDVISYKVRHEYGGAVVDYRGFYLGNN